LGFKGGGRTLADSFATDLNGNVDEDFVNSRFLLERGGFVEIGGGRLSVDSDLTGDGLDSEEAGDVVVTGSSPD